MIGHRCKSSNVCSRVILITRIAYVQIVPLQGNLGRTTLFISLFNTITILIILFSLC
nr:hypothetical protein [uncultured bacterium]